MHSQHIPKASFIAMVYPELYETRALDHLELAIDLAEVLCLALRVPDYHDAERTRSMAEIADTMRDLLKNSRDVLVYGEKQGGQNAR